MDIEALRKAALDAQKELSEPPRTPFLQSALAAFIDLAPPSVLLELIASHEQLVVLLETAVTHGHTMTWQKQRRAALAAACNKS